MRFIYFLLAATFLTACGHQKIRFSKVKRSQKIVEVSEIPSLKKKTETAFNAETELEETEGKPLNSSETSESDQSIEESSIPNLEDNTTSLPQAVKDSTTITADEAAYIKEEAIRAEKLGTWSLISSIASPLTFLLAMLLFAFSIFGGGGTFGLILSVVLGVSVLVFLVLSFVFGIASLRAPYNTTRGRKFAVAGLIIGSLLLVLLIFNILIGFF